ncbi:hypothetical protein ScPMuIL_009133 [Solemya velum]
MSEQTTHLVYWDQFQFPNGCKMDLHLKKSLTGREAGITTLKEIKAEREATIERRKKIDTDLKLANQEITKKMGCLTKLQSSLHYKNEEKINEAIRRLEWQLHHQNFKLSEERKIVAEVDSLKRSKKILSQYLAEKKEIDDMRDRARRMREERDHYYRAVTNLKNREDDLRKVNSECKYKHTALKQEIDDLYETKRRLIADFRRQEKEYQERKEEFRKKQRMDIIKKKEEERRVKNEAIQKDYDLVQKPPYEDELNLCTTLISYVQRCHGNLEPEVQPSGDSTSQPKVQNNPVSELEGGLYVLRKKQEDEDYSAPRKWKRNRRSRKLLPAKLLTHTPQIFAQFDLLNLKAPANMTEVPASIEQLFARKKFYEEATMECTSISKEMALTQNHQSTNCSVWPDGVWTNMAPNEEQSQSENGLSVTESLGDNMSRQLSKTESSGSLQDTLVDDKVIEELVKLSAEDCHEEKDTPQILDRVHPDHCNNDNTAPSTIDSVQQIFIKEVTDYIYKPDVDSIKCTFSMSLCDNDSNDENSTVRDSESECNCSRQNSSTADSTDCAENEVHNIDNENDNCENFIDTVIVNEDQKEYINCQDMANLDKKCLVTGTELIPVHVGDRVVLPEVEGESTLLMT